MGYHFNKVISVTCFDKECAEHIEDYAESLKGLLVGAHLSEDGYSFVSISLAYPKQSVGSVEGEEAIEAVLKEVMAIDDPEDPRDWSIFYVYVWYDESNSAEILSQSDEERWPE